MSVKNLILVDNSHWQDLLPLTFTRPICELRVGILTIKEKWQHYFNVQTSYITQNYLSTKYALHTEDENLIINSSILPNQALVDKISSLKTNEYLQVDNEIIAAKVNADFFTKHEITLNTIFDIIIENGTPINTDLRYNKINRPYHIFSLNKEELISDFDLVTQSRKSAKISETNNIYGHYPIFLESGVSMEYCTINTIEGPVYLGKDVEIMEGTLIRGGFAACEGSIVKMGAKIYGATTMGPHCRLGGEVNNCVLLGYSNKGHDGFLGNSVIGEWCNLGADTNNSNLKNNYLPVKIWSYSQSSFKDTGLQFCGLIMGDHSKSGINTMFNTGTVVGVAANIFGSGFPRTYIPSFSWGGAAGMIKHQLRKAIETADIVMQRRHKELTQEDKDILEYIFTNEL